MVKLDKIDRKLLYQLDLNCRLPDVSIAKKIGRSRESVRYRIDQLQKKGLIRKFHTIVNLNKIGFQGYELFLNLTGTLKERDALRDFLLTRPNVYWVGVSEGSWDVGVTLFARNHNEFFKIKEDLFQKFRKIIIKKTAVIVVNEYLFSKKYILPKKHDPTKLFGKVEHQQLDAKDLKVLSVLVHNARASLIKLSQLSGFSVDIIRGRMKKMEKLGVIVKYTVDIDYNKLGLHLFKVFLYFKEINKSQEKRLLTYCAMKPEIVHYGRYISEWEIELDVMVSTFQHFNSLIREIKDEFSTLLIDTEASSVSEEYVMSGNIVV